MLNHNLKPKIFSEIIEKCATQFGGIPQLADALNISTKAIYQWEKNGVPEGRFFQLEILTEGKIKAIPLINKQKKIKNDIYPPQETIPNKH